MPHSSLQTVIYLFWPNSQVNNALEGSKMQIKVGDRVETVRYFHCYKRGVDRVFVDHPMFLEKVSTLPERIVHSLYLHDC